jgi:hypothetical protein
MQIYSKVDLSYRAKLQHITNLIRKISSRIDNISPNSILTRDKDGLKDLKEILQELTDARATMKEEFEACKINALTLQAKDVLKNHEKFMVYVKTQKEVVTPFNEITTVRASKKKILPKFS